VLTTIADIQTFAQSATSLWVMQHVPVAVFVFCFGACVGSFLYVVIYRLPQGMSVTSPPSRCPTCGARLRFFRENIPIVGWIFLRGKCRYCGVRISPQYMVIELIMALTFLGLYFALYAVPLRTAWWGEIGGPWWMYNMVLRTWPTFIAWTFLLAGLLAMTVIDARTFTIPIQIPLFITVAAMVAYPLQALMPLVPTSAQSWPIPGVEWRGLMLSIGGMLGVALGYALLRAGKIRYSFADYHEYLKDGETLADYPHARREMIVELVFLSPCLVGMSLGWFVGGMFAGVPGVFLQAVGATLCGYLMGCGLIWAIRILGSLAFGREAMGLGDVHLLGAVGAVLGWFDPILIFFLAPFSGIVWAFVSMGIASLFRRARRELPYGPHLAAATLVVILCRPGIHHLWSVYMPNVPMPKSGLVAASTP
jgi:leader peptidase (prepilin peptidase)/N-methyltransferase